MRPHALLETGAEIRSHQDPSSHEVREMKSGMELSFLFHLKKLPWLLSDKAAESRTKVS